MVVCSSRLGRVGDRKLMGGLKVRIPAASWRNATMTFNSFLAGTGAIGQPDFPPAQSIQKGAFCRAELPGRTSSQLIDACGWNGCPNRQGAARFGQSSISTGAGGECAAGPSSSVSLGHLYQIASGAGTSRTPGCARVYRFHRPRSAVEVRRLAGCRGRADGETWAPDCFDLSGWMASMLA